MKPFIKIVVVLFLSFFIFSSCEKDLENISITKESVIKTISFKQFKNQTKMKDFETVFKLPVANSDMSRSTNLNDYVIDTLFINQHIYGSNKSTYTFQVYPNTAKPLPDENYNLVYRKVNNSWEKTLIHFTEQKVGLQTHINNLVMLYDSRQSAMCFAVTTSYHCTNTGDCSDGTCDGCDLCVSTSEQSVPCPGTGGGPSDPGNNPSGPLIGGTGYNPSDPFSFVPNIYENPVYNDANYVNTIKAHHFWNNLSASEKTWVDGNSTVYLQIVRTLIINNWNSNSFNTANQLITVLSANNATAVPLQFGQQTIPFANILELHNSLQSFNYQSTNNGVSSSILLPNDNKFSSKTVELNSITNLTIETICATSPFTLKQEGSVSYLSNFLPGNSWVQNSMTITNTNYSTLNAQITLSGYVNIGVKVGDYEFGIKHRYLITLLINKQTGALCCSIVERNFN